MKYYATPTDRVCALPDRMTAPAGYIELLTEPGASAYRLQCRDDLRALVPCSGARIWASVRHITRTGQGAGVSLYVVEGSRIVDISRLAGEVVGAPIGSGAGVPVKNEGGMQWALANQLMRAIWPDATTADLEVGLL